MIILMINSFGHALEDLFVTLQIFYILQITVKYEFLMKIKTLI